MENLSKTVFVLVVIAMLTGIGVMMFDKFSGAVKIDTTATAENIVIAAGTGTTANDDVTDLIAFYNTTASWVVDSQVNITTAGTVTAQGNVSAGTYKITYKYDKDTTTSDMMDNQTSSLGDIGNTWFALVVTVIILSFILIMVIRSFGSRR